ncbi:unnamed protein product [Camellia sinensis]
MRIARKLVFSGYGVFAMDYPGFGLSEGLHGYIPSFDILVDDVIEQYSKTKEAALEAPRILNLNNNKYFSGPYDVVFIANDWHIALLPCYLKTKYKPMGIYKNARVVFCIHNIAYQGRFPFADFSLLNLPEQFKGFFDFIDGYDKPAKGRKINWMKGGILESDRVVTVSPYYAQELVSGIDKGVELDNIIRKTGITGIVNGMDVQEWNPSANKYIDVKYNATTLHAMRYGSASNYDGNRFITIQDGVWKVQYPSSSSSSSNGGQIGATTRGNHLSLSMSNNQQRPFINPPQLFATAAASSGFPQQITTRPQNWLHQKN